METAETFMRNKAFPNGITDEEWTKFKHTHSGTNWVGFAIKAIEEYDSLKQSQEGEIKRPVDAIRNLRDEYAREEGFENWEDLYKYHCKENKIDHENETPFDAHVEEILLRTLKLSHFQSSTGIDTKQIIEWIEEQEKKYPIEGTSGEMRIAMLDLFKVKILSLSNDSAPQGKEEEQKSDRDAPPKKCLVCGEPNQEGRAFCSFKCEQNYEG